MNSKLLCTCALILLAAISARAQQPGPQSNSQPGQDPIGQSFFPPELVMQHQEEIGLTADQKSTLKTEIRQAQLKFTEWQWKLQDDMEKLVALVKQPHVDEQGTLVQLEKVLATEREIKRAQITLLVHIKNTLTSDQQSKLEDLRDKSAPR